MAATLLVPAMGQAFAHHPDHKIQYNPRFPPVDSVYVIDLEGSSHLRATDVVKPISAHLEYKVTSVKTKGVPSVSLTLINGNVAVGDNTYSLNQGSAEIIPVNQIQLKQYSEDSLTVLTLLIKITEPLPLSTSDEPADIGPALRERTGTIQVLIDQWVIDDFTGNISRVE